MNVIAVQSFFSSDACLGAHFIKLTLWWFLPFTKKNLKATHT